MISRYMSAFEKTFGFVGRTFAWFVMCILAIPAIPFFIWLAFILFWIEGASPMNESLPFKPEGQK